MIVLDSSATLAHVFVDERTKTILELFDAIASDGAWVPELWRIEVANSLSVAVRRGRITKKGRDEALVDLSALPISIDDNIRKHTWGKTLELADKHRLTLYDATYLELALRLAMPLATLDDDLRAAGQLEGVVLLGK
jgi:predicted nucleic acid-binding protein